MKTYNERLQDEIRFRIKLEDKEITTKEETQKMNEAYDCLIDILASLAMDGLSKTVCAEIRENTIKCGKIL